MNTAPILSRRRSRIASSFIRVAFTRSTRCTVRMASASRWTPWISSARRASPSSLPRHYCVWNGSQHRSSPHNIKIIDRHRPRAIVHLGEGRTRREAPPDARLHVGFRFDGVVHEVVGRMVARFVLGGRSPPRHRGTLPQSPHVKTASVTQVPGLNCYRCTRSVPWCSQEQSITPIASSDRVEAKADDCFVLLIQPLHSGLSWRTDPCKYNISC